MSDRATIERIQDTNLLTADLPKAPPPVAAEEKKPAEFGPPARCLVPVMIVENGKARPGVFEIE